MKNIPIHIPSELSKFLKHDSYSLLIKGHAGTGKTTLALSILQHMKIDKNCIYISTRVSPEKLLQYHSWIGDMFTLPLKSSPTDLPEALTSKPTIVDARLDEPNILFERITNELMDVRVPTIIMDTWEAISYFMDKDALMNNVRVLQTWRERAGAKLIFVSESPDDKTLDFLVDGVVELKLRHHNERGIREIVLSKLRGIKIERPSYLFSVNKGIFRSYERHNPSQFLQNVHMSISGKTKTVNLNDQHISSGYHEFDELLGGNGYPQGSTVSIEIDSNVNAKFIFVFLSKIFTNFINSEDILIIQPLENSGIELIEKHLKNKKASNELVNVFRHAHNTKKTMKRIFVQVQERIQSLKKKFPKKRLLTVISSDTLEEMKSKHELNSFLYFIKSNSSVVIFVSRHPKDSHSNMPFNADTHLRIIEVNGTVLIQPDLPWSHMYAMVSDGEKQIEIDPLV